MAKKLKTDSYFKRFQVKYRRRREGKTDYYARKRLIAQPKDQYDTPKYRFVVRITNKEVICQVVYARIQGDVVFESAYSHELKKYGITFGLKNYAAAYCTGLLCARRVLKKLGLDTQFQGSPEANGESYIAERTDRNPFKAILDVGLRRTTTGARIFAAMKGALDGGMYIPHSDARFPGYDSESEMLDSTVLRKHIHGGHVADYMRLLEENDPEKYKKQFGDYLKQSISADSIESVYEKAHGMIRDDPDRETRMEKEYPKKEKPRRTTRQERREKAARRSMDLEMAEAS